MAWLFARTAWGSMRLFLVLVRYGLLPDLVPGGGRGMVRIAVRVLHVFRKRGLGAGEGSLLGSRLMVLGPSYVKLGQFLATRPDIVGFAKAEELSHLQDRMPVFSREEAMEAVLESLESPVGEIFADFGEAVAAASIAQVHRGWCGDGDTGETRAVAVKVLRPGVEKRLFRDLRMFKDAARLGDWCFGGLRRLRLPDVVETLRRSVEVEVDLRMEAAALSEMAENVEGDEGFRVPAVDWTRSGRRVLTMEWIEGVSLGDREALVSAGHDPGRLARILVQSFLRHAMRDGFFHGDMHQGNLLVEGSGTLVAVDFGIMGRLGLKERYFLAEILWGFIQRDYPRISQVHFEAGYVPQRHSAESFAQALRAIGESLVGRNSEDISMAKLLAQLFEVTGRFDMPTRPELLLLQKSMLIVEGVARSLDPKFNMWKTAEPVVREWMEEYLGPEGILVSVTERLALLNRFHARVPQFLEDLETVVHREAGLSGPCDRGVHGGWGGGVPWFVLLIVVLLVTW